MSAAAAGQHRRPRRLFPVRRRGSSAPVAIEAGPLDFHASQPLAPLREAVTGEALEPLPEREPGRAGPTPLLTAAELANLEKVAGRLRALPSAGDPERVDGIVDRGGDMPAGPDEDDLPPSAFLRAVIHDGPELTEPIGHTPVFAGLDTTPSGIAVAGMYLGTNEDGWFLLDATDPAWCDDLITAATAMRDALVNGSLRPVPAWADEDGEAC